MNQIPLDELDSILNPDLDKEYEEAKAKREAQTEKLSKTIRQLQIDQQARWDAQIGYQEPERSEAYLRIKKRMG